jgi:predicted MPP superfamily phosphohydrolase
MIKYETVTHRIKAGLEKPLRAAVVSDLHGSSAEDLLEELKSLEPNLILCPGDTLHSASLEDNGLDFLRRAAGIAKTFCSLGNHEVKHGGDIRDAIRATGAVLLDNEYAEHAGLVIGGLSTGYRAGEEQSRIKEPPAPNVKALDGFFAAEGFKLLLSHHPEYLQTYAKHGVDLALCGHAHGGQVRIGQSGIIAPHQGLFPKYTAGQYTMDDTTMILSRGLGNSLFPWRINNPPELVVIELQSE